MREVVRERIPSRWRWRGKGSGISLTLKLVTRTRREDHVPFLHPLLGTLQVFTGDNESPYVLPQFFSVLVDDNIYKGIPFFLSEQLEDGVGHMMNGRKHNLRSHLYSIICNPLFWDQDCWDRYAHEQILLCMPSWSFVKTLQKGSEFVLGNGQTASVVPNRY